MRKLYLLVLAVVSTNITAQDVQFNQPNFLLTHLNPSFAGSNGGLRLQTAYQNFPGSTLSGISADVYLPQLKGGISVSALSDSQSHGTLNHSNFSVGYAQHFRVLNGDLKIIPSVQFSYFRLRLDVAALNFGNLINQRTQQFWINTSAIPSASKSGFDFNSGLLFQYKNSISAGFTVLHINEPDIGLLGSNKLNVATKFHGAYTFHFNDKRSLQIMTVIGFQGMYGYLQQNSTLVLNHFIGGIGVSTENVYSGLIGFRHNFFTAQFGYFFDASKLRGTYYSTWELHLSANIRDKEHRRVLTNIENW